MGEENSKCCKAFAGKGKTKGKDLRIRKGKGKNKVFNLAQMVDVQVKKLKDTERKILW
ncbi:MAG: hypothetical protein Q4C98_10935 [Capnocytophaga sp.]|nr:hypothetical protein [Capnocytophaga sp.]